MKYLYLSICLMACGGNDFTSSGNDVDASTASSSGGTGGETAASGMSSVGSGGGSASPSASSSSASSSATSGTGGDAPCVPSKTCASESAHCGAIDDGCGLELGCGDYKAVPKCNSGSPQSCACEPFQSTGIAYDYTCADDTVGSSPPPASECQPNPGWGWCCPEIVSL